MKNNS